MSHLRSIPSVSLRNLVTALFFSCLVGCGGSAPTAPAPVFPNVTGNWQFEVAYPGSGISLPLGGPIETLSGSLSSTGSKVTGTLTALSIGITPCISGSTDIQVSGTIDSAGNLNLTAPISGGVATMTALVAASRVPLYLGTYQVIGGPCAQASVPLASIVVPNISGTYAGTLTEVFPQATTGSLTVKAALVESSVPNADGKYPLTGSITYSGDCSGTFSLTNYFVSGINVQSDTSYGETFSGGLPLLPTEPLLAFFTQPAGCAAILYNGNLTLQ